MTLSHTAQHRKQQLEREAFAAFTLHLGISAKWVTVESRPDGEPDLLCTSLDGEVVAFELVSLTDPRIAEVQAAGPKARTGAFWTEDSSARIIRDKLGKAYHTRAQRIELLVYTNGRLITPDDVIVPTILPLLEGLQHPFEVVWFMGEEAVQIRLHNQEDRPKGSSP